jgi:hypothetical protein
MKCKNILLIPLFNAFETLSDAKYCFKYPAIKAIVKNKSKLLDSVKEKAEIQKKIEETHQENEKQNAIQALLDDETTMELLPLNVKDLYLKADGGPDNNIIDIKIFELLDFVGILQWE